MRYLFGFMCVLALSVIGCGDDETGSGGTAGTGGVGGMGGSATVTLAVAVLEATSIEVFDGPVLEGVELCEADTTNCETTDAAGMAQITVQANQEITYTLSKDGYGPYVVGDVSDVPVMEITLPMFSNALLEADAERLMVPWPWDPDGVIGLAAFPLRAGATYDLVDDEATPYYRTESGVPNQDLTETTSNGRGGFHEVSPGEHQVEFGGTATNCTPATGWPGNAANQIRVPVRSGHISFGSMSCDEP